jgi:hypothetical protein
VTSPASITVVGEIEQAKSLRLRCFSGWNQLDSFDESHWRGSVG